MNKNKTNLKDKKSGKVVKVKKIAESYTNK